MPNVFSQRTLAVFEDASASIVLRQLNRSFEGAGIRMGDDPGGSEGSRRTQFRRYVAGVDQRDPQQLDRLGDALGALIKEVAASKEEFLVKAAERDGFFFADGVFRRTDTHANSFAVSRVEDLALIDALGTRLHLLADDSPKDAIGGAKELVESVCRTVLRLMGEPAPKKASDLVEITKSTVDAIQLVVKGIDDGKNGTTIVRGCLQQLCAVVSSLAEMQNACGPRHARLAVGAAVTVARFVAETYLERDA